MTRKQLNDIRGMALAYFGAIALALFKIGNYVI